MDKQQSRRELNILLLGETGVGKSTWMNAFINYLTYATLDEAENGQLLTLIVSKFSIYTKNFQQIIVSTGEDSNESGKTGQSATQLPKVYTFIIKDITIRFIDTPGIGDTRGIDEDKKNFENILATLSNFDELHGICILLKPNSARLTVMFRFCITELLTYLHRDASKNIVFCFTNTRGTLYLPGDTLPALADLLSGHAEVQIPLGYDTIYCFDAEAYRFLAAVKNNPPVVFSETDRKCFADSWIKSIEETERMLTHIKNLPPHKINSTINLNHARELVLKLTRPLAEVSRNIEDNKNKVEREMAEVEEMEATKENLERQKKVKRSFIEARSLPYPRTVCGNQNCMKDFNLVKVDGEDRRQYKTVCHDNCSLSGIQRDSVGDPGLASCVAMRNDFCLRCQHHYREHLHVYYESIQIEKEVENTEVIQLLQKNLSAVEQKREIIRQKQALKQEYEDEQTQIQQASVKFAFFLKVNAITPYNDAMEDFLDHLIREERNRKRDNDDILNKLIKNKESYVLKKTILEMEMNSRRADAVPPTAAEIDTLATSLQSLKHSGQMIKDAMRCMEEARNAASRTKLVENTCNLNERKQGETKGARKWFNLFS